MFASFESAFTQIPTFKKKLCQNYQGIWLYPTFGKDNG
jgi:hypothetical protein